MRFRFLSGALLLARLELSANTPLCTVMVSLILMPAIVAGVSTMICWRDMVGVEAGVLTAMIAQSVLISSVCMLMFMARLRRQDRLLEEAGLNLGASPFFVLRRITLPFLMPAIATSAGIAFLQSIENCNTTFLAIVGSWTPVTEIGARMRFGLSPVENAIGVIFVVITVVAAFACVMTRRRAAIRTRAAAR